MYLCHVALSKVYTTSIPDYAREIKNIYRNFMSHHIITTEKITRPNSLLMIIFRTMLTVLSSSQSLREFTRFILWM